VVKHEKREKLVLILVKKSKVIAGAGRNPRSIA